MRPPLEGEAKEKFIADPNFLVKKAKSSKPSENVKVEGNDKEFCPGISVRSAEPGVMVAQVPGMKARLLESSEGMINVDFRPAQLSGPAISQKPYAADLAFGPDIGNDEVYTRTVDAHDVSMILIIPFA